MCEEIEVVFHFRKLRSSSKLGPTTFLYGYLIKFCSFLAISLLVRAAGRPDAGYIKIKANFSLQAKLNLKLGQSLAI